MRLHFVFLGVAVGRKLVTEQSPYVSQAIGSGVFDAGHLRKHRYMGLIGFMWLECLGMLSLLG